MPDAIIRRNVQPRPGLEIRRGVHKSVQTLEKEIHAWIQIWNEDPKPFVWKKTAEDILDSLAQYIAQLSGAGR